MKYKRLFCTSLRPHFFLAFSLQHRVLLTELHGSKHCARVCPPFVVPGWLQYHMPLVASVVVTAIVLLRAAVQDGLGTGAHWPSATICKHTSKHTCIHACMQAISRRHALQAIRRRPCGVGIEDGIGHNVEEAHIQQDCNSVLTMCARGPGMEGTKQERRNTV